MISIVLSGCRLLRSSVRDVLISESLRADCIEFDMSIRKTTLLCFIVLTSIFFFFMSICIRCLFWLNLFGVTLRLIEKVCFSSGLG